MGQAARVTCRNDQNGNRFGVGLSDTAKSVFRPGAMLHTKHTDFVAGREARIRVCHMQTNTFLTHDYGSNIEFCGCFDEWVDRIRKQRIDSFSLHRMGDGINYVHGALLQWIMHVAKVRADEPMRI